MKHAERARLHAGWILLAALWMYAPYAQATTECTATQPTLDFGSVATDGTTDVQGSFSVTCRTFGLSLLARARVLMCLNLGAGASGSGQYNPRRLVSPQGDILGFQVYRDPARTLVWGSRPVPAAPTPVTAQFDYAVPLLGGNQTQTFTLYGRIAPQAAAAGTFSNNFGAGHTLIEYRYNEQILGTPDFPASCSTGGTAGTPSAFPFLARATVPNRCVISTATNLSFGAVPGLIGTNRDRNSSVTMTCTGRTAWNMALDQGQNAAGAARRMRRGTSGDYVGYELYRNAARTQRWGATPGVDTVQGTGTGGAQTLTVFGRVPAGQAVPAGAYRDVVTVTVTY
ncbi:MULTISPECIES: Csu type fimbrial protein [unclassified Luteimonas]